VGSCKNLVSSFKEINLQNSRIIEEDYSENDCDSVMPRLEQNKSSQEGDLESEEDFFEGNEDAKSQESKSSCSTPRFSQDDQEFTIVKLN